MYQKGTPTSKLMTAAIVIILISNSVVYCVNAIESEYLTLEKPIPKLDQNYLKAALKEKYGSLFFTPGKRAYYKDLNSMMSHIQYIAKGSAASVYKGIDRITGKPRIAKVILKTNIFWSSTSKIEELNQEVLMLELLPHHPNICKYYQTIENKLYVALIFEVCGKESIGDRVKKEHKLFSEKEARPLVRQILKGVEAIHAVGIYHIDLHVDNVLMTESGQAKIIDFGVAINSNEKMYDRLYFDGLCSPEMVLNMGYYPEKADVWSVGSDLYFMISGSPPFGKDLNRTTKKNMKLFKWKRINGISEELEDLFEKVFVPQDSRPTASKLLEHPWFQLDGR